jgi:hypothetical protein
MFFKQGQVLSQHKTYALEQHAHWRQSRSRWRRGGYGGAVRDEAPWG